MLSTPFLHALSVAAVFVLGGFVKGVVGLGLPTITMGLLSLAMPPGQAAALLVVPSLVTNVWQIGGAGFFALLRRLATLLVGICAGVWWGAGALTATQGTGAAWAGAGLGVALVVYAVLGLLRFRWKVAPAHEPWLAPLVGVSTGLVTAATGVFVIPAVPYLQALGLAKDDLVRALGLAFLVATVALGASLGRGGALPPSTIGSSLLALVPALAGMAAGTRLRRRVEPETFKRVFFCGLLALGTYLALRGLAALA
ncbi:MAG: sulfite exporter TauE/SafE family protein [Proteobacteria bacterium]|nr:sulfite exporter TauE/SafE family protein [Pseudomonadota bacterium]